ncbi:MAG: tetratricopeptide repeat protein, partial [Stellaceae bacterium]
MDHPAPVGAGEAVFQQAVALHERGRLDQAELLYRALLGDNRDHLGARHNLGILCFQRGDYDGAVALTREVVRQQPELATAHNTLAVALKHLGRLAEAESSSREAVRQAPEYAEAHNTLGDTLTALGRFTEAEQCCRTALRLFPEYAEAHNNLATVLLSLGRPEEAEICARRALRLKPLDAAVHANLGAILFAAGRLDQAELCYREALRLNPTDGAICGNLGNTLDLRGELSQAVAAFERALTLRPGDAALLETWFSKKRLICDWARFLQDEAKFRKGLSGEPRASAAFRLLGVSSTPAEQFTYARRVAAQLAVGQLGEFHGQSHGNRRRLRVGYLFLIQPTGHLIAGLVENHDRQRFEIIGYSASLDDGSALRLRLARAFDRFVDVSEIQDQDAAGLIRNDQLDILVDLIGFKPNGRAKIPAHRPSPLQVNYLGYPGTMGADYIDYIIVDRFVAPQNQQPFFSERLVHLPGCYQCNDDKREIAAHVPSRAECGLPERGFVFCCFNDSYKLTPAFFDIWMQLLNAVPGSVLWLLESAAEAKGNLAREAAARGVAPERI